METSVRRAFGALGALSAADVPVPASADDRMSGMFYGRAAGNIEVFRRIGDNMPGSSGDVLEEKLFGRFVATPSRKPPAAYRRYPVVAVKLPRAARRPPMQLRAQREEIGGWWRTSVVDAPPQDLPAARKLLQEAADRFISVGELHTVATLLASALLDALGDLAERAVGDRALAMELATGYGAMEETELIEDLWSASRDELPLAELLRRHGYHGPDEGDLSSVVWREDAASLQSILRGYRKQELASVREREARQFERREAAETKLLAGLPRPRRPGARLTMKLASTYIPLREIGKAAFLHCLDAARCAARVGGRALQEQGVLADAEDVFFLTLEEFLADPTPGLAATVAERKARHERYVAMALPPSWTGDPEPVALSSDDAETPRDAVAELQGIGVVGEQVTGRARVVHDPMDVDLEDGDILVCKTTDPSWTPLFMLVEALVIDMGGQMSHGAIVARELGVPCVINTVTGTRDIPDGATITVDGSTGRVVVGAAP